VKVITSGTTFAEANDRMDRALREFRIRGVKTNIPFLENLISTRPTGPGRPTTTFIDDTPSCSGSAAGRTGRRSCSATSAT
jgi:pyruvate carboxylase